MGLVKKLAVCPDLTEHFYEELRGSDILSNGDDQAHMSYRRNALSSIQSYVADHYVRDLPEAPQPIILRD